MLLIVGLLVSGCSTTAADSSDGSQPSTTFGADAAKMAAIAKAIRDGGTTGGGGVASSSGPSVVAQAKVTDVAVYQSPEASTSQQQLHNPQPSGAPLVFLVTEQRSGRLHVLLPTRPNGSTGWIRSADVSLSSHDYRIVVNLGKHLITTYRGDSVIDSEPVGVGRANTPTPGGVYYIKELLRPDNPNGPYGPYAYGLSGFSNVLKKFGTGDGVIGIHGTNDPTHIGSDVSHGCIRMSNAGITKLARILPLGVPVQIIA